ncbi:MAG: protein translocase subunit SecF, partial [bacterium]|nr:protein translocase subunit SecF [bacterium]
MFIVKYRKIFFAISAMLVVVSIAVVIIRGLHFGIDFKGGSLTEVSYKDARPETLELKTAVDVLSLGDVRIQPAGERDVIIRTKSLSTDEHSTLLTALSFDGKSLFEEKRFSSIGPVVGKELRSKAWVAIFLVILGIVLFVAFAFRHVSEPVASWKYGLIIVISLLHDIIIPTGVVAFLGKDVDTLFIIALLSIMGLSVHDSIVVFDRVRENLRLKKGRDFSETVGKSLEQTFVRSINTSLTIILVLFALYFFGPTSTKDFSLILLIGMFFGTYSSIFLGSPLLV